MTITFGYFLINFIIMDIIEGIFLVLVYLMFIFSSKNQPRENKSSQLLKNAGIIGIVLTVISVVLPQIYCLSCTASEIFVVRIYAFSFVLVSLIPMLLCLGISLFLVGKRNEETNGKILMVSGILWILAFAGYAFGNFVVIFMIIELLVFIVILSYLAIPAVILMIVHGAKLKDRYFVLAGIFYIISWFVVVFIPWLPYLPI
ncbi:MAG: hypothetical protein KGD70_14550 [Candidatus Lokiarchaeota archaeon]|nr:hypothetical protein [Candidatus Lokiarchaeota archaeon]